MIDDLARERDILNKNLVKATIATTQQADLVKIAGNTKRNLEMEINSYRASSAETRRQIHKLGVEKFKYKAEADGAQERYAYAVDEVKDREITVLQLQKKISEGEAKLKQQQNLYEAVMLSARPSLALHGGRGGLRRHLPLCSRCAPTVTCTRRT